MKKFVEHLFVVLGGFAFAFAVIRGRDNRPSGLFPLSAWGCGSAWMALNGKPFDSDFLVSRAAQAGVAFMGWRYGKWLCKEESLTLHSVFAVCWADRPHSSFHLKVLHCV